ncbi:MAG: metallophosphoesterase [Rhodothermales bacterium]
MARIAHISDIHFGKIAHPDIVQAIVEDVNREGVDLVAVSGDLTQRAFPTQFKAARAMLDAFEAPWLAVPGNHDVFPWWRPELRLSVPVQRFKEFISDDLTPNVSVPGAHVLGVNSAHGWTVMGGKLGAATQAEIRTGFDRAEPDDARILVVHHHLQALKQLGPHDVSRGATQALQAAADAHVDVILCGHLHISHVDHVTAWSSRKHERRILVVSAGTATSTRGRAHHRKTNFYNILETDKTHIHIQERQFNPDRLSFFISNGHTFQRV